MSFDTGTVMLTFKKCRAAGIVLYRLAENGDYEVLGLEALPHHKKRSNGIYDLPKGKKSDNETSFECALRECVEETGLSPKRVIAGPMKSDTLWMWLAECEGAPILGINPHIQTPEHLGFKWLTPDELISTCLDYLRETALWVKQTLNEKNTNQN